MLLNSRSRSIDLVRVHKAGPSGQTLQGSFSAVSMQIFESNKHSFESSLRDLHNALLCTSPQSQFLSKHCHLFSNREEYTIYFVKLPKFTILKQQYCNFVLQNFDKH